MGGLKKGLGGGTGLSGIEEDVTNDLLFTSTNRLYFRDAGISIYSNADGKLTITSDGTGADDIILSDNVQFASGVDLNSTLDVDATTTSTNAVVDVAQAGTGRVVFLDQNNTGNPDTVLEIDDEATGATNPAIEVSSLRTGTLAKIQAGADAAVILELEASAAGDTSAGLLLDMNNTGNPPISLEIDDEATGATNSVLQVASKRTGTIAKVIGEADAAVLLELEASAAADSSAGLLIDRNNTGGTDSSLEIDDEGTGAATVVKVVSKTTGSVALFDAEGAAGANGVVEIQHADGANTNPTLLIDNNETDGVSTGIKIDLASTGAANAFQITAVDTDAGPIVTNGVQTDIAIDTVSAVFRITNGTTTYYVPCLSTWTN